MGVGRLLENRCRRGAQGSIEGILGQRWEGPCDGRIRPRAFDGPALVPRPRADHAISVAAVDGRDRVKQRAGRVVQPARNHVAVKLKRHLERVAHMNRQVGDVMGGKVGEGQRALRRVELDEVEVGVGRYRDRT